LVGDAAEGIAVRTLADWLQHLETAHSRPIDLGLERVEAVRAALDLRFDVPVITVGGTNGKGSVCAFLEAILHEAGYRVGLYTSPHVVRYNERVRIDGVEASDAALVGAFERVEAARGATSLTYFEMGTLAAACIFADAALDVVILEVGLGGRLDAVNVFDPDCAVLVTVDLDHMDYLGPTREDIGREKAGIFRADRPAIYGELDPPRSVLEHAERIGARLQLFGREFGAERTAQQWKYRGTRGERSSLPHPALRGAHQISNAAVALAALDALKERLPVHMQAVRAGLLTASPRARFQVMPGRPAVVFDVSHNPHAARALAANLRAHVKFKRTLAVFSMLADKDVAGVIDAVTSQIAEWYVAGLGGARGSATQAIVGEVASRDPGKPVHGFASLREAYAAARQAAGDDDRIVVFGSFHTVCDVLQAHEAATRSTSTR
jgi:dihydrofolate synthase/folylpolyglutamate synthase